MFGLLMYGLFHIHPERDEPPLEFIVDAFGSNVLARTTRTPEVRSRSGGVVDEGFVEDALMRCILMVVEDVLEYVQDDKDQKHEADSSYEPPLDARYRVGKRVDVHAEESDHEHQWQEDEGDCESCQSFYCRLPGEMYELQDRRHRLWFSCRPNLESLTPTDLYRRSLRLAVGWIRVVWTSFINLSY